MSEFIELGLELVLNVVADLPWPDTKGGRISWGVFIVFLGGIIWWELR